jgi:hypothetical protein
VDSGQQLPFSKTPKGIALKLLNGNIRAYEEARSLPQRPAQT